MSNTKTAKTTKERLQFAIAMLEKHDIEFSIKNEHSGHLHCRRKFDDKLMQFWAGTGKIMESEKRGIHNFIEMLTACDCSG